MADRNFPIIEGEPAWANNVSPLDPFHFNDSMAAAGFHVGESGDWEPTFRGNPAVIDLYALGPAYNDPLRNNQPGTLDAPIVAPVVAAVVTPTNPNVVTPTNQNVGAPTNTLLVLGVAAVVVFLIFS